ncbi:MAG: 5-oxoprolinase subunit PxpB [Synergistes sp.]|nr:5-oxoprolinase subunit PxpB [Synergistes sp.]
MSVYIDDPKYLLAGESCVVIEFANEISREANDAVMQMKEWLLSQGSLAITECLPTYRSLAVYFDALNTEPEQIIEAAKSAPKCTAEESALRTEINIPVCYGGEYGPDLANVAEHAGITAEEVIKRHTERVCHCYMIGFLPGFAYLGGMDESIATPRLAVPRTKIAGGSVGIAGKQTGIYPIESPGGWQLIGRTPIRMFDVNNTKSPTAVKAGYDVRFVRVSEEEYKRIEREAAEGTYKPDIREVR